MGSVHPLSPRSQFVWQAKQYIGHLTDLEIPSNHLDPLSSPRHGLIDQTPTERHDRQTEIEPKSHGVRIQLGQETSARPRSNHG